MSFSNDQVLYYLFITQGWMVVSAHGLTQYPAHHMWRPDKIAADQSKVSGRPILWLCTVSLVIVTATSYYLSAPVFLICYQAPQSEWKRLESLPGRLLFSLRLPRSFISSHFQDLTLNPNRYTSGRSKCYNLGGFRLYTWNKLDHINANNFACAIKGADKWQQRLE